MEERILKKKVLWPQRKTLKFDQNCIELWWIELFRGFLVLAIDSKIVPWVISKLAKKVMHIERTADINDMEYIFHVDQQDN